jgi:hypothetical protein
LRQYVRLYFNGFIDFRIGIKSDNVYETIHMEKVFAAAKALESSKIKTIDDLQLYHPDCLQKRLGSSKVRLLELENDKIISEPKKVPYIQYVKANNISISTFKPTDTAECVVIHRKIIGQDDVVKEFIAQKSIPNTNVSGINVQLDMAFAYYAGYAPVIVGNEAASKKIRDESNKFFEMVQYKLAEVNNLIDDFNDFELPKFLKTLIDEEIKRRDNLRITYDLLR